MTAALWHHLSDSVHQAVPQSRAPTHWEAKCCIACRLLHYLHRPAAGLVWHGMTSSPTTACMWTQVGSVLHGGLWGLLFSHRQLQAAAALARAQAPEAQASCRPDTVSCVLAHCLPAVVEDGENTWEPRRLDKAVEGLPKV